MLEKLEKIAKKYHLSEIYAFGSRAIEIAAPFRNQASTVSMTEADVDIGVQPERGYFLSARDKALVTIDLEDLLDENHVDLVVIPEAGPFLALDIIKGELLYCIDDIAHAENELYVLRRAGYLAHYDRERRKMILNPKSARKS